MAYILDGVVILIFLLAIYFGYRRGFVRSIIHLVGCIAAALIAFTLSKPLASSIFDLFFADRVQQSVSAQINGATGSDAASVTRAVDQVVKNLPAPVANYMAASGYTSDKITSDLSGSMNSSTAELSNRIVNTVVKPIAVTLLQAVCYMILFVVLMILVGIVASMINHVFHLPVLRQINGTLGAILGAVQGVLFVFIAVAVMSMIAVSSDNNGKITQDVMKHTVIVRAVEDVNPITDALYSLLK